MNLPGFLGKVLADILAVHKNVIDDARNIDLLGLAGLNRVGGRGHGRLRLLTDLGRRQLFHMCAAAYRALKQTVAFLRRKIFARGKPTLEAVLILADEVENDNGSMPAAILAYMVSKTGYSMGLP